VREAAPLVQEKLSRLDELPDRIRFLFEDVRPDPALLDGGGPVLEAAAEALEQVQPFESGPIEAALRSLADRLGLKPRQALGPIRLAVTGSKVSPGLWESLELLGRDESLRRIRRAVSASA
jgi:glutamyl-tRNA synthetase